MAISLNSIFTVESTLHAIGTIKEDTHHLQLDSHVSKTETPPATYFPHAINTK